MKTELYPRYQNPLLVKPSRPLPREVAIIGAGTIGPDIGYYFKSAIPGIRLVLVDVLAKPLAAAQGRIGEYIRKGVEKKKMRPELAEAVGANIVYTTDYEEIRNADLVIEAATENVAIKRKIVAQVEALVSDEAIITSNTSSMPAEMIFSEARLPGRTTVTHFFAPAWRSPAVEVITWPGVRPEVLDYLNWLFCVTGKTPLMSLSKICFILDRVFDNWCNEAALLLPEATSLQIDQVAEDFVYAGPFFVLNMSAGNPIIIETNSLQMEEGEHYRPAQIFRSVGAWLTRKRGTTVEVAPELASRIRRRLLGILFSQSFDIINRGIGTAADLNLGCQLVLGFRQGPLDVMRDLGEAEVLEIIGEFQRERPGMPGMARTYGQYQEFLRHIIVDEREGVKIITIRRPHLMNVLSDEVNEEIRSIIAAHEHDPAVEGFVITGYGTRAFSAGAEIGKFPSLLGDEAAAIQYCRDCSGLLTHLDQCEKPVVAAVNGLALGGGLELALRCHEILATGEAWFQFPEITLGILPGIGGLVVPYRRWPEGASLFHEMILQARRINAAEASRVGMVTDIAADYHSLIEKAIGRVKGLKTCLPRMPEGAVAIVPAPRLEDPRAGNLKLSTEVAGIAASAIDEAARAGSFTEALEIGYRAFGRVACTGAAREGIGAFLEKRSPQFTG